MGLTAGAILMKSAGCPSQVDHSKIVHVRVAREDSLDAWIWCAPTSCKNRLVNSGCQNVTAGPPAFHALGGLIAVQTRWNVHQKPDPFTGRACIFESLCPAS